MIRIFSAICLVMAASAWQFSGAADSQNPTSDDPSSDPPTTAAAVFAGGCFWCLESPFDKMPGVISTISGYTGGRTKNPTYEAVKTGLTGHIESIRVTYDPSVVQYEQLLWLFWHNIDPMKANGQFCDEGGQYRSMIFYNDESEKKLATESKERVASELGGRVRTEIVKATTFYPAEEYHQDYYLKNPAKYKFYRWTCGRDARLDAVWGDKARKPLDLPHAIDSPVHSK